MTLGWIAVTGAVLLAALAFLGAGGEHPWLIVMLAIAVVLFAVGRLLLAAGI